MHKKPIRSIWNHQAHLGSCREGRTVRQLGIPGSGPHLRGDAISTVPGPMSTMSTLPWRLCYNHRRSWICGTSWCSTTPSTRIGIINDALLTQVDTILFIIQGLGLFKDLIRQFTPHTWGEGCFDCSVDCSSLFSSSGGKVSWISIRRIKWLCVSGGICFHSWKIICRRL